MRVDEFRAAARTGYPEALRDLKAERDAYAVRDAAYSAALKLWQEEHPKAVVPRRKDLCVWLMGENGRLMDLLEGSTPPRLGGPEGSRGG